MYISYYSFEARFFFSSAIKDNSMLIKTSNIEMMPKTLLAILLG